MTNNNKAIKLTVGLGVAGNPDLNTPPPPHPSPHLQGGSEVQTVALELQPWAVLTVELTEPAPVLLDGWVLLHQKRLGDVLLIIPDHHVALKLCTNTCVITLYSYFVWLNKSWTYYIRFAVISQRGTEVCRAQLIKCHFLVNPLPAESWYFR